MLSIDKLNSGYGKLHVLFDITTEIKENGITVLVGPNGSGKSTLLKSIFGLTNIFSGDIRFKKENVAGFPPHVIARMGIAYLPQTNNIFTNLKVRENLVMAGYTLERNEYTERLDEALLMFPILQDKLESQAGTLSGGQRQMLAMAMAIIRKPEIMMFDEPTASLAPKIATQILQQIISLRDESKITIILAEQNAKSALEIGDNALLLVSGQLTFDGKASELLNHEELGKLYLGIGST